MSGYVGKIKNTGAQVVKAPVNTPAAGKEAKVKKGGDLRSGK